jgi:hypothetical protein
MCHNSRNIRRGTKSKRVLSLGILEGKNFECAPPKNNLTTVVILDEEEQKWDRELQKAAR